MKWQTIRDTQVKDKWETNDALGRRGLPALCPGHHEIDLLRRVIQIRSWRQIPTSDKVSASHQDWVDAGVGPGAESKTLFSVGDADLRGPVCAEDAGLSRRFRGVLRRRDNYRRW
jgi:hypothetical protein